MSSHKLPRKPLQAQSKQEIIRSILIKPANKIEQEYFDTLLDWLEFQTDLDAHGRLIFKPCPKNPDLPDEIEPKKLTENPIPEIKDIKQMKLFES